MKLSVVIPVYNEEKTLAEIITKVLDQRNIFEVIIVDDGSTDDSAKVAEEYPSKEVRVISYKKNCGKGAAIICGIKEARGDLLIIQDADLECDPKDYSKLLEPLVKNKAEFVVGNRWAKFKKISVTKIGTLFLALMLKLLFGSKLNDPYSCYKAAPLWIWRSLKLTSPRFEIEAEIVAKIYSKSLNIVEVPVRYHPRSYQEGKKIKLKDAFKGAWQILKVKFDYLK